jgi:glycosyltransferase involved in cell wall biosynthesis
MNYLINLCNQIGAGPKKLSLQLISELESHSKLSTKRFFILVPDYMEYRELQSSEKIMFVKISRFESVFMKAISRLYVDLFLIPRLVKRYQISGLLAFGNFLLSQIKIKKTVLLHHPYLFDDDQLSRLSLVRKSIEKLKRFLFNMTLRNVDEVVVETDYVLKKLSQKWPWFKGKVHVIENPISWNFPFLNSTKVGKLIDKRVCSLSKTIHIIFVSRFYPHKNHIFLCHFSELLQRQSINHKIMVTVDTSIPEANNFLKMIDEKKLPIINLGEIDQKQLSAEYEQAHLMIFPSESETFGIPLIEALNFALPVMAPNLEYAEAILGKAGIYFKPGSLEDCFNKLLWLINDKQKYVSFSHESHRQAKRFKRSDQWLEEYLNVL